MRLDAKLRNNKAAHLLGSVTAWWSDVSQRVMLALDAGDSRYRSKIVGLRSQLLHFQIQIA